MSRFVARHVFRKQRFSLGVDAWTSGRYISLPVSGFNRAAEFEAYFTISDEEFALFSSDPDLASDLVAALLTSPDNPRRIR